MTLTKKELKPLNEVSETKKRVLIFDGMNQFLRSYVVDPSLTENGDPIGGTMGFLKSFQKILREMKPDIVCVVWDGPGGSRKRRQINKNYKEGRAPVKLNRNVEQGLTEEQKEINKKQQFLRLIEYLNNMPIIQFMFEEVEADDVIGYITQIPQLKGMIKIIVSSDKDFYQLCDNETLILRPIQKQMMNAPRITEKFGIHPKNFACARSIVGDASDNIKGIDGAGLPTVAKRFPFLKEPTMFHLNDIFDHCMQQEKKLKLHNRILDNMDLVRENFQLCQLHSPKISARYAQAIRETFDEFSPDFNKMEVIKMMANDGFDGWNWTSLFATFRSILHTSEASDT